MTHLLANSYALLFLSASSRTLRERPRWRESKWPIYIWSLKISLKYYLGPLHVCNLACEVILFIKRQSFNLLSHPATKQINQKHCIKTTIAFLTVGQTSPVSLEWQWWQQQLFQLVIPSEPNNVCICGVDIIPCAFTEKHWNYFNVSHPLPNLYMLCELNRTQVPFFLSEPQCVTSSECSEHCSHLIPLHVALGLTSSLYSLILAMDRQLEERRMESDGKIRTIASPIS